MADLLNEKDQLMALEKLLKEGKAAPALELAKKLLKEFPDSFQIKFTHAKVLRATGQLEQAEEVLQKLISAHRSHLNLLLEMATLSRELKKNSQALDYYNQALFIDPFNKQAKTALVELRDKPVTGSPAGKASPPPPTEPEKKKWQADTLPEEDIGKILDEEKWPEDKEGEEPITHESIRMEDEIESINIKPSIPGVDEAYVRPDLVKVEGPERKADPTLEESLMPDPDFQGRVEEAEDEDRVTTDDLAPRQEASKADTASTRRPATGSPLEGDEFVTESAAQLYLSQGLYEEALFIYEKLHRQKPEKRFAHRIEELKSKCQCQKKIQALSAFLKIIQERGG